MQALSTRSAATEHQELLDREHFQSQNLPPAFNPAMIDRMDLELDKSPNFKTIYSPIAKSVELQNELNHLVDADGKNNADFPWLRSAESDDNNGSSCNLTCHVSDFLVSDMIFAEEPFYADTMYEEITGSSLFSDFECSEQGMCIDMAKQYMILSFPEAVMETSKYDAKLSEEIINDPNDSTLYIPIDELKWENQECEINPLDFVEAECFISQFLNKDAPNFSDTEWPVVFPKKRWEKHITLVLDLDETLVHSTLEHTVADFTFPLFFNMKERIVYVKQRPNLLTFLETVSEMFEIIVFTASQKIYADKLLDILDPNGKFIFRRAYCESCIFSDGGYTKDLSVLGVDLAKVAIIDNSPQVFRLQVNNGIPIKSWFCDPSDDALISLLPFLETLADVEDVRPIIAKKFGNA